MNWKEEISKLVSIKQMIASHDKQRIWPHHLPELAVTDEAIDDLEKSIKHTLAHRHREFLQHADGWRCFYQSVDLFGTSMLLNPPEYILSRLAAIDPLAISSAGISSMNDMLIIAATESDLDYFAMAKLNGKIGDQVYWFAGQLIESFTNFEEFFLSMMDYSREELADMKNEHRAT